MHQQLPTLTDDCPSLRFGAKFADVEALSRGDTTALRPVITNATRERLSALPPAGKDIALVIGGNGFVGAHLVARLSREPGIHKVWATVRATAECTPKQRLEQTLALYDIRNVDWTKVAPLNANPTQSSFGLTDPAYQDLSDTVDMVFNTASSSDYSASYLDLRDDWVKSLLRVLQFAADGKRKHVTYMGSISSYFYQTPRDFRRPDSWWYSGYAQMKWVNGEILRWLSHDTIMSITLCEAPYVLGATTVGLDPGFHYSWWRVIEVARNIGMIWDGPGMNYVPVDVLVDALTRNAMRTDPLTRILPRNPDNYDNGLLADLLRLKLVNWDKFISTAIRMAPPRCISTDLSLRIDKLIHIVNKPEAILPEGSVSAWPDNRSLYELYLRKIQFRDFRTPLHPKPLVA